MSLALVTAPATEPLLLEEAKQHLRLEEDFSDDDEFITTLIGAARRYLESNTARAFLTQTWRLTLDEFPCDGVVDLPRPKVIAVSLVQYVDGNGATQTMSTSDYSVDVDAYPGRIVLGYGKTWPSPRYQYNAVTITFTAGFGDERADVPDDLKAAMKLLIGHWYENREAAVVGVTTTMLELAVDALVGPYRFLQVA